jgi:predicted amidohydrolase YtcJ
MRLKTAISLLIPAILMNIQQSCKPVNYADMILLNGKIITVDNEFRISEGIAVTGDKITAVGSSSMMRKLSGPATKIIDLRGKTVIPGLTDSHLHPETASLSELEEEIPDLHSISQLLGWIRGEAEKKKKGIWIIHPKFFPTRMAEMRQPTLAELDSVAPENPVFLNGSFGGMVNSAAMVMSGISGKINDPGILIDKKRGTPAGFIRASAFNLLKLPPRRTYSKGEKEDALRAMLSRYNEYGITSLFSGTGDPGSMKLYREMADRKMLTARIYQNILLPALGKITKESVNEILSQYKSITGDGDEWVRTGSLKIFLDGGILTGTAYMNEPWGTKTGEIYGIEDPSYRGVVNFSREELLTIVTAANEAGWSFSAHATGEGSVDMLLDVYSEVNRSKPVRDKRFSIIHGNFFSDQAIKKMADLGVYANMQPAWFYKDAETMETILGKEKIKIFHPYRRMTDAGVMINGGSDHMVKWDANTSVNPYNPFLAMWSMITRKTERGAVIVPSEAISRKEALRAYTINNAYASFEESVKGSLEPGKLADMAVLSDDILTCPEDSIKEIRSLMTIVGGKIVYEAGSWE